jgi:hypothetical protein
MNDAFGQGMEQHLCTAGMVVGFGRRDLIECN